MYYKIVTETATTALPLDLPEGTTILSASGKNWPMFRGVRRLSDDAVNHIHKGVADLCVLAPMQWGKTSFIQALAEKLPEKRLVYCCSYDRNTFKRQMKNDASGISNLVVLFQRDFKNYRPATNDVVVFDECHYGDKANQSFDAHIRNKADANTVFVWLSATPFAALARESQVGSTLIFPTKEECSGYLGLWDWLDSGFVYDVYDLESLVKNLLPGKYGIIRQRNSRELRATKKKLEKLGVTTVVYNQQNPIEDITAWTRQEFHTPTVLLVQGNLVQGDRIDNTNLQFTYEYKGKTASANIDTAVQSLIGRSCGWKPKSNCIHVTSKEACLEYVQAWERLWAGGTVLRALPPTLVWSSTVASHDSGERIEAKATVEYFPLGYPQLPEIVRNQLVWGLVQGRNTSQRANRLSTFKANNEGRTSELVMTKSYFGKGLVSEANLDELLIAIRAFRGGVPYNRFQTFARQGTSLDAVNSIKYGIFFVNTDELASEGVASGSCFLLTRTEEATTSTARDVQVRPISMFKENAL